MTPGYVGQELHLFAQARNWKAYLAALLRPHLVGRVLEVGAGLGATTGALCDGRQTEWRCLEPDPAMARALAADVAAGRLPPCCRASAGTIADLPAASRFDAILYVDVLEHVEDDRAELAQAAARLTPEGVLVVLSPAHPWLYSPFDAAIGHWRRYTRRSLAAVAPGGLQLMSLQYLDSVGLCASAGNRLLLRRAAPTPAMISLWDRWLVPLSRRFDPWFRFRLGKSVLAVWRLAGLEKDPPQEHDTI
jgi:SAM-dependent methyltransferase